MPIHDCNQTYANKRLFRDFIYALPSYELIITDQQAELAGETADLLQLQKNANEITETLLLGLQSVGTLLANVMESTDSTITKYGVIETGHFISLVAECAFSVNEVAMLTGVELSRRKNG